MTVYINGSMKSLLETYYNEPKEPHDFLEILLINC